MCERLYLADSYKRTHSASITGCAVAEDRMTVQLDETIFHPQGGGQLSDPGTIQSQQDPDVALRVSMVSYDLSTGAVSHTGAPASRPFAVGEAVRMEIDWEARYLHMRLHSGGHLIDHAIQLLGCPFRATKANHYPSGPSVEFQVLDTAAFPVDRDAILAFQARLQAQCDELIRRDPAVKVFLQDQEEAAAPAAVSETHAEKAAAIPEQKMRLVLFEGCPAAVPCGGTHVARAAEIGHVLIKKVQCKDGLLRVSYRISP